MQILAFGHKKGSGKDQICQFIATYIRSKVDKTVQIAGFADHLKDICFRLYSWAGLKTRQYYEENREDREKVLVALGKTPRQIWIQLGQHMKQYDQLIWLNSLLKTASCNILLIKDLGFITEYNAVKDADGYCIKITRPNQLLGTDPREVELDDVTSWDKIIDNSGTLADLYTHGKIIAKEFLHL